MVESPGACAVYGAMGDSPCRHKGKGAVMAVKEAADTLLTIVPKPQECIDFPPYYEDPSGDSQHKFDFETQTAAAYTLALAYALTSDERYLAKAAEIINAWVAVCRCAEGDGRLHFPMKLERFISAADYMGFYWSGRQTFIDWLIDIYIPICTNIVGKTNNWGAIGLAGLTHAHKFLASSLLSRDIRMFQEKTSYMILSRDNMFGKAGELWQENLRNNSGMWYYYYTLAPMLKTAWLLRTNLFPLLERTLDIFYRYCLQPETWPYKKLVCCWPFTSLQQWLWPSSDTVEIVGKNEVLQVAGYIYNRSDWSAMGKDGGFNSNYWLWSEERIANGLI